jgi:RNA polymerase sigma-70 factor, ECF subfamily
LKRAKPTAEDLVRTHGPTVWRLLQRMFGSDADIEDTFQQVMLELVRALPGFRGDSEVSTWVHRVALNIAYQRMRQQYRSNEVELEQAGSAPAEVDVEAEVAGAQAARMLYACLEALPPKKRMAVVLHDIEGLTLRAIGERLGIPLQTVASQLQSGRAMLAEELRERRRGTLPEDSGRSRSSP